MLDNALLEIDKYFTLPLPPIAWPVRILNAYSFKISTMEVLLSRRGGVKTSMVQPPNNCPVASVHAANVDPVVIRL